MNKFNGFILSVFDRMIYSIFGPAPAPLERCSACSWFRYHKRIIFITPIRPEWSAAKIDIEEIIKTDRRNYPGRYPIRMRTIDPCK